MQYIELRNKHLLKIYFYDKQFVNHEYQDGLLRQLISFIFLFFFKFFEKKWKTIYKIFSNNPTQ